MIRQNIKLISVLIAIVFVLAVVTGYVVYNKNYSIPNETVSIFANTPGEAPYSDMLGNPIALDAYLGKVLVVTSWASWSPFSATDLNMLNTLASGLNNDEIVFLAINRMETKDQAARFMNTQPKFEKLVFALDPRDNFYNKVGGYAMPEVVIFNKRGEIILHDRGVANREVILATIENLYSEK